MERAVSWKKPAVLMLLMLILISLLNSYTVSSCPQCTQSFIILNEKNGTIEFMVIPFDYTYVKDLPEDVAEKQFLKNIEEAKEGKPLSTTDGQFFAGGLADKNFTVENASVYFVFRDANNEIVPVPG
ncbi:hypothetical protein JXB01_01540, partial [Candidatus Micrarchaeota archaeon]|nr:hypothetical protein [Candidatus Micrarchaeota archaeon]